MHRGPVQGRPLREWNMTGRRTRQLKRGTAGPWTPRRAETPAVHSQAVGRTPMPKPAPSILTILSLIQKRPSMYLGWDQTMRRKQLHALQAMITGYTLALHQHGVGQDDLATIAELEDFLRRRSKADNFSGIDQVLATSPTEDE